MSSPQILPVASNASISDRDATVFLHQNTSTPVARALVEARGNRIRDADGHWTLDFHGNSCHNLGYGHPRLLAAAADQLARLPFAPRRFTNEPAVALAEALLERWPGGPGRVLFAPSGSDAVEIALKIARLATGRHGTIAFEGAWHGAGFGALAAGGREADRPARLGPLPAGARYVPRPDPWAAPEAREATARASLAAIAAAFAAGPPVACLLAEPTIPGPAEPPPWYWPAVADHCRGNGALLVFDEIPGGLGRSGCFFASDRIGVAPDVTVLGKALGGAIVPLAAVIARADLNVAGDLGIGHYTHEKSALGCRIGLEVVRLTDELDLPARAAEIGAALVIRLRAALPEHVVEDLGGPGARIDIRLGAASAETAGNVVDLLYARGLNLGGFSGRLSLVPPLSLEADELEEALSALLTLASVGAGDR